MTIKARILISIPLLLFLSFIAYSISSLAIDKYNYIAEDRFFSYFVPQLFAVIVAIAIVSPKEDEKPLFWWMRE